MYDLSILIPARNEEFLVPTIQDILKNKRGKTEIIVVLDGYFTDIPQHDDVTVIHNPVSVGQRAATNQACKLSNAKYVIKTDAHCAFDEGFDVKLMADMQDDWTVVPTMRNLHVFDWVCEDGHRRYQSPSGVCKECGKETKKDIVWIPKTSPQSTSYCFDSEPHFQYFSEFKKRPEGKGDLTETMSLQGSFFMLTREKYWELNISDEAFGSWGSQGIEVAVKTWLSGGRVICNQKTWYAHMFRTQGGDFGFPYPLSGEQVAHAKKFARKLFYDNKWEKQIHPLHWLIEKFYPVPGWSDEDIQKLKDFSNRTAGIVYYTDNEIDPEIMTQVQEQIKKANLPIVSVSLKPLNFGKNVIIEGKRGYLTMFKQILAGLEALDTDVVFFCEHDVLYHQSHFDFRPLRDDKYYYNMNSWIVRTSDGFAVYYDHKSLSGLCADRQLLIKHYKERIRRVELEGFSRRMGFEPGTHNRPERVDDVKAEGWKSEYPNLDLKHGKNLTQARWRQEDFRDQRNCRNWIESNIKDIKR